MIVILKDGTKQEQVIKLQQYFEGMGLRIHMSQGENSTIMGLIGDTTRVDDELIASLDAVEAVRRIQEPYKNANRKFHPADTVVDAGGVKIGGGYFQIIAGPCSVESETQMITVARAVKAAVKKPVFIKLTPNVTDICAVARACEEAGADGISMINTLLGMRLDLRRRRPLLANVTGGLSGPAVFPVALRMVYQVYEAVDIPIIGMGGVSCAEDVLEMMLAGASAVQIGAMNLVEPYICRDIVAALPETMEKYGMSELKTIIGGAHNG